MEAFTRLFLIGCIGVLSQLCPFCAPPVSAADCDGPVDVMEDEVAPCSGTILSFREFHKTEDMFIDHLALRLDFTHLEDKYKVETTKLSQLLKGSQDALKKLNKQLSTPSIVTVIKPSSWYQSPWLWTAVGIGLGAGGAYIYQEAF